MIFDIEQTDDRFYESQEFSLTVRIDRENKELYSCDLVYGSEVLSSAGILKNVARFNGNDIFVICIT